MSQIKDEKLDQLEKMIQRMDADMQSIKDLFVELSGKTASAPAAPVSNGNGKRPVNGDAVSVSNDGKIIEGVFDGEAMIGPDGRRFPVPPNYASKSKLVGGDILKLTITDNGSFIYKQIGPVERIQLIGTLKRLGNEYYVATKQGDYRVLTASVTYYKAEPGDQVTVIVAAGSEGGWGAIENIIPRIVEVTEIGGKRRKSDQEDNTLYQRS